MKVTVTGATGFIGGHVVRALLERGDEVIATGRSAARIAKVLGAGVQAVEWDAVQGPPPAEAVDGVDGIVNLAGENVAKGRWSRKKKNRIRDSRIIGTRHLVQGIAAAEHKPRVLVQGSAIGFYGDRQHQAIHETYAPANDFLGQVCVDWEAEAAKARAVDVRVAMARTGIVLGKEDGAYPRLSRPFRMFLGAPIGAGRRWMSWIHIDDEVGILLHLLDTDACDGAYNLTAPNPSPNAEFSYTLASVLKRPCFAIAGLPLPFVLPLALGEFAKVLLASQRILPQRTVASGYEFKYPELRPALENLR